MRTPRSATGHRGSAAVEFALVLPLVLVVVLGLVQVGLLTRDRLLVEAAARAGARAAALGPDLLEIQATALQAAPGLDPARATVEVNRVGTRGEPVEVRVAYAAAVRVPLVDWLIGSEVDMATTAVARQEFG